MSIRERVAAEKGQAGISWSGRPVASVADASRWWNRASAEERIALLGLQGRGMARAMVRGRFDVQHKAIRLEIRERLAERAKEARAA